MELFSREIERKYTLHNVSYAKAFNTLKDMFGVEWDAVSNDIYWEAKGVDFIRLRENSRELTVKVSDKGTTVDRIEENVRINSEDMEACKRLQTLLNGPPSLKLTKEFSVFNGVASPAPGTAFPVVLCLYRVQGDPLNRVFFECEAGTLAVVDYMLGMLEGLFNMEAESRSLYAIFRNEQL